ncbi:serine/threonine kinase 16 [Neohortaea acidophila]|uniref:Serine/threonine kinase 16 n=1 Tax=Neohortaea acidophila TaxID=245834 RepID=A0A6A6PJR0_9PEZI|nr:serine/threonine kinase 16 [Neohortaea acidophila]KAF2480165.1 serine/threonine kinase 16 [Neohortaea acidophila]
MEMNSDANELHQIEKELNVEILPGTEIMTDVGSHHFVKGSRHVLVPQPSSDPHDPLNWTPLWKSLAIISATTVSFTQGFGPLSLAPTFGYLIEAFHSNLTDVVRFTGVAILVLGFSNFIWVPLSTSFGRRPVYIVSQLVCLGSAVWRARATTYGSFMGACVLNGIGAGPAETIQLAVIADIFFLHDRGFWNTLYWVFYMGSLMVAPIISGSMALHLGWRAFWWLYFAMTIVSLLMVIFMFPETKWHRLHPDEILKNASTSPLESSEKVIDKKEEVEYSSTAANDNLAREETADRDPWLGKGKPSKQQWKFYQPNANPWNSILMDLWIPWKLFAFPIAEFTAFVVSWSCSSFLTINLTQAQNFAVPPYNFTSQTIGFTNFAILIGAFIGLATNGILSDWISDRATRKNKGIREPEMRLPAMIPYVCIMILGNFVVAFGYQQKWPWEAIVIIGYTCAGIQVASIPAIVTTYAVDSYKPVAGSLMVAVTVNKNVWGYGFAEFITPWIIKQGYIPPIMTNMSLITLWCSFGILFYYCGKTFRRWSRNSSVHRL